MRKMNILLILKIFGRITIHRNDRQPETYRWNPTTQTAERIKDEREPKKPRGNQI